MADGIFPSLVSATRDVNAVTNPIYVNITDGTTAIGVTSNALDVNIDNATIAVTQSGVWDIGTVTTLTGITNDVNIADGGNSITVDAANLDIRDLSETTDQVLIFANTAKDGTGTDYVPLVDADGKLIISNPGSGTEYTEDVAAPQPASGIANVVERDDVLSAITPAEGDWSKLYCNANGALWVTVNGTVAVSASDLDIRDLTHVSDSVTIGDGTETLNITAAGEAEIDIAAQSLTAVKISKDASANTELNPIYVHNVDTIVSGEEIHDYDTAAGVASDATDNHDYTVVGTMLLKSVIVSGSGNIKFEVQTGPTASLVTVAVGFLTGRQGDTKQLFFDPAIEVPVTGTGLVRIIRTNRQGAATDLYSTIIGNDV